jgi:hypothetical protein
VLEWNEEAMNAEPLPGYVWLDTPGKVLHAPNPQSSLFLRLPTLTFANI